MCDCTSVYDVHVWCVVCGAVCACGVRCVWYACRGVYPACGLCVRTGVVESVQCACLMNKVFLISYLPGMCKRTRLRQTPGFGIGQRSVRKPWRMARAEAASGRSASSPGSRSPCSSSFPPCAPGGVRLTALRRRPGGEMLQGAQSSRKGCSGSSGKRGERQGVWTQRVRAPSVLRMALGQGLVVPFHR